MEHDARRDWLHDLILPTLLFMCLGAMTWAVRGCSGFGALKGCTFAGVTWGIGWWYLARQAPSGYARRYASAWIVLALTVAVGASGARGWMQWVSFWDNKLLTDASTGAHEPISRMYGYLWLFIAGVPWAGLGACALAWTASQRPLRAWEWVLRIASGFGVSYLLGVFLFNRFPEVFLPLYSNVADKYHDFQTNPNLRRLFNDNQAAIRHLGFYLGFLIFEISRRDWKNVTLITTVGVVNGLGWALLQNWTWAKTVWPDAQFNYWRCWESSGGVTIGLGLGIAYFLVNRPMTPAAALESAAASEKRTNYQWAWATALLLMLAGAMAYGGPHPIEAVREQFRPELAAQYPLYLVVGVLSLVMVAVCYMGTRGITEARREARHSEFRIIEWLAGFALMLVFAWFVMGQASFGRRGDGDEAAASFIARAAALLGDFSAFYFYIALAYGLLSILAYLALLGRDDRPRSYTSLDTLATYLGLLMVVAVVYGGELRSPWQYHVILPFVAILFALVYFIVLWITDRTPTSGTLDPNLERWGLGVGLALGLGLSLKNGLRGWANIYIGEEEYWTGVFWTYIGAVLALFLLVYGIWVIVRRRPRDFSGELFPYATTIVVASLLHQNIIAQLITGPVRPWKWVEQIFSVYYLVLFAVTLLIVYHYHRKTRGNLEMAGATSVMAVAPLEAHAAPAGHDEPRLDFEPHEGAQPFAEDGEVPEDMSAEEATPEAVYEPVEDAQAPEAEEGTAERRISMHAEESEEDKPREDGESRSGP